MFKFHIDNELDLILLEVTHADKIFSLVDTERAYLREWLPWIDGTKSALDIQAFIQSARNQYASNNGFHAGIWYKGEHVGVIGFHRIDWSNRSANIGYWLSQKYQGKGIMTRSCQALVNYALNELNLHRVEIRCAEGNHKSRSIPERLGFTTEGIIRDAENLYNHYVSHVVYGILADEYQAQLDNDQRGR